MPHATEPAARTLAVWAMFFGTLLSSGCAPFRVNQNEEMLRQLDELPPAIKIETATPVGMTNRDLQTRQQERAELRSDAPQEPPQRRRGAPDSTAPRFQPAPSAILPATPATQREKEIQPTSGAFPAAMPAALSRPPLSSASQAEYLRALDQAGINDPAERADMLAAIEATDPSYRTIMLRTLKANTTQRQPKPLATRAEPSDQDSLPEEVSLAEHDVRPPPRRDHLAMVNSDPIDEPPLKRNARPAQPQPLPRKSPAGLTRSSSPAPTNPIRQVAHLEPEPTPAQSNPEKSTTQDPEQLFREALTGMERQLKNGTAERTAEIAAIRLRLLQALAGQRDAALVPVANLSPAQQEFLSQQIYALAALVDQQGNALWSRRAALTSEHLQTAADKLSQQAGLLVRNAQLCTEIKSFGNYTTFAKTTFRPNQEVLLYAELDRFQTRNTERGFHTKFHAGYQILDRNGRKIVEKELGLAEEFSPVRRRDYFVSYLVRLPAELPSDEYTLKLMIEDQLGGQVGETSVRLMIEGAAPAASSSMSPLHLPIDKR